MHTPLKKLLSVCLFLPLLALFGSSAVFAQTQLSQGREVDNEGVATSLCGPDFLNTQSPYLTQDICLHAENTCLSRMRSRKIDPQTDEFYLHRCMASQLHTSVNALIGKP